MILIFFTKFCYKCYTGANLEVRSFIRSIFDTKFVDAITSSEVILGPIKWKGNNLLISVLLLKRYVPLTVFINQILSSLPMIIKLHFYPTQRLHTDPQSRYSEPKSILNLIKFSNFKYCFSRYECLRPSCQDSSNIWTV